MLNKKYFILFLILISIFSCKKSPQELYIEAIDNYKQNKDSESETYIINDMLQKSSFYMTEAYRRSKVFGYDSCYYLEQENKFIMTNGNSYSPENEVLFAAYNPDLNYFAYSDGFKAYIIDLATQKPAKIINISKDNKISIDGFTIAKDEIIYFYKRELHTINLQNYSEGKMFSKSTFSPPFSKNSFRINIITRGSYTALTVGHAGKYNLSILNRAQNKVVVKNKKVSSYSIKFVGTKVYYVAGSSGKWIFANYNISNKNIESVIEFKKLRDLRFSESYSFILEDDKYVIFHIPTEEKISIPSKFELIDIYEESIILKYNNKYYFCRTELFFDNLEDIRIKIPGFLSNSEM